MKCFVDSVQIHRDIQYVFDFITNISNVEAMFEHIVNVQPASIGQGVGLSKYQQTRRLHGVRWHETVEVIVLEDNTSYTLSMLIFGVKTIYSYSLEPVDSNSTSIYLTKEPQAQGLRRLLLPLIHHVLLQPEHDGKHLNVLKKAIERS